MLYVKSINHAAPVCMSCEGLYFHKAGSSFVVELSHMVHRLCESPSIPLSFSVATVLPRRIT